MKKQIIRISIYQTSKILAIIPTFIVAIFAIPIGIVLMIYGHGKEGGLLILYPVFILLFIFIAHTIFISLYNFLARHFGGVEFTEKDVE